jgi:Zn-dependent protease
MKSRRRSIRLFRFAGIDVYLHWYWFLFAAFEISNRAKVYSSIVWNVLEYLALFFVVLLHEYGHALACRQVGGTANEILLWPLGGMAYVSPPQRPGATLWSSAAGPLVNIQLLLVFTPVGVIIDRSLKLAKTAPDVHSFLLALIGLNGLLLGFNLLPIYPLDGGQIIRSLLWYVVGRARSLMVAAVIGFACVAGLLCLAVLIRSYWIGFLALFILLSCWGGLQQALTLSRLEKLPHHEGFSCPSCKAAPPVGRFWTCSGCRKPFDTFQTQALCPNCAMRHSLTMCLDCSAKNPLNEWIVPQTSGY